MKSKGSSVVENVAGEPGEDEQAVDVIVKPVFPFFESLKEEALLSSRVWSRSAGFDLSSCATRSARSCSTKCLERMAISMRL